MTTITLSGEDFVVAKDLTLTFVDEPAFFIDGPSTLINKGTVSVRGGDSDVIGLETSEQSGVFVVNAKSAHWKVSATGDAEAFGMTFLTDATVSNAGVIKVTSESGATAVRLDAGGSFFSSGQVVVDTDASDAIGVSFGAEGSFTNRGQFSVTTGDFAEGAYFAAGGSFTNSGSDFTVHGEVRGTGVLVAGGEMDIRNTGVISATSNPSFDLYPIGIAIRGGTAVHIDNSGTISAESAIEETSGLHTIVTVHNSGTINGAIELGAAQDSVINSGLISDSVFLGGGADVYLGVGQGLADFVDGGEGDDQLTGGARADELFGDAGDDLIQGGKGGDMLTGGGGADTFVYVSLKDSRPVDADLITDLNKADFIDVSGIDADSTVSGDQAFTIVAAFDGHAGEMVLTYKAEQNITRITLDVDGDGKADAAISVQGDHSNFGHFVL